MSTGTITSIKVVCPSCQKPGTITTATPIKAGARLKCIGCGHIYRYQEDYELAAAQVTPAPAATAPTPPPRPVPTHWSPLLHILRLPGWIALATGALQFVITVGGAALGTAGNYQRAKQEHTEQVGQLQLQRQAVLRQPQTLQAESQQLQQETTMLAQEMQQLIGKCDLKVEAQAALPQPVQLDPAASAVAAKPPGLSCMDQYLERKARYEALEQRWQQINRALQEFDKQLAALVAQIRNVPGPQLSSIVMTAVVWSSGISAITPLMIAYLGWVLGIVMACLGCLWLALVRRIFLAPAHCYLEAK
jgi:hypothetical protein